MTHFQLTYACIDAIVRQMEEFLKKEGVPSKEALRTQLLAEEALLNYRDLLGEDVAVELHCIKRLGRLRIDLSVAGDSCDPFVTDTGDDTGVLRGILSRAGMAPVWQYKNGHNLLIFSPKKKKPPQIVYLLAAVASALLLGSLFSLCAPQLGAQLSEHLLQPLFSTLGGLLTAVASVLVFLSLVSGILGIGDVASFGKIGKTMFGRILLLPLMLVLCYSVLIAPLFPISIGSQFSGQLADLLAMVLDIVPDSMVTPFTTGNLLQIAFMSVLVGLAMLVLGAKVSALSTFVEQANSLFQIIMEGVCSYVPIMVFLSLFDLIVSGSIAQLSGAYKPLVLIILGCIFCMGVYFLLCLRNKVPPLVLAKKLLPAFLVGLITASTASALPLVMEGAPKKLGVAEKVSNFAVPLGQVLFMPATALEYFVLTLCMAEISGLTISVSWLAIAVFSVVVLAIATPPVPGGGTAALMILFAQLGIPPETMAIAVPIDILVEFAVTGAEIFCQQCELIQLSRSLHMLDSDLLRKGGS